MAIAVEDILKKSVSSSNFAPVYILFGEDGYLKQMYSDKIAAKIAKKDDFFNYSKFTNSCNLQEVYDFVLQLPMMSDKKYAELFDYDFENCSSSDFEKLCNLLTEVPDTAVLVLRFEGISFDQKKSGRFKKLVASAEKNGGMAVNLSHRSVPELIKMLTDGAAKRGCRMDSSTARYLIEQAGEDILLLSNELNKLCAYTGNGAITKDTVEMVSVKTIEASIFNLSKSIFACNCPEAMKILDELFFMRVEYMIIFSSIYSSFVDIYRVYLAKEQGLPARKVAELFNGYNNKMFLLDKAEQNLRRLDINKIKLSLDLLVETDKELKSFGKEPRIVLEQLIVKLIFIISKGEAIDKA